MKPSSSLSHIDCHRIVGIIEHCVRSSRGGAIEVPAVLAALSSMLPIEHAVVATARVHNDINVTIGDVFGFGDHSWLAEYRHHGFERVDPVVRRAMHDPSVFAWSDAYASHPCRQADFLRLKNDLGRKHGIAGACRGRVGGGRTTLISLSLPTSDAVSPRNTAVLDAVLPHVHEMLMADVAPPEYVRLTPRETEILAWMKDGKSVWEVGCLLAISERTVKFHLSNAYAKLDAVNRTQAIAKALRLGMLAH